MRRFSPWLIVVLCVILLLVDILSFQWLSSITPLIGSSTIRLGIHIAFWVFSIAHISAILMLRLRMNLLNVKLKYQLISRLYGLVISSVIPKFIFIIGISFLNLLNVFFNLDSPEIILAIVGVLFGVLPFLLIIYGIFITLYKFQIKEVELHFKNLPSAFHGLRIVQISDLHLGSFNYQYSILENAFRQINKLKPDLLLFTGDMVNNYAWETNGWETIFNQIEAPMGKYAVLGNHDYGDYSDWSSEAEKSNNFNQIKSFFEKIEFQLLLNEHAIIPNGNDSITIIGVENWGKPPFKQYGNLKNAMKGSDLNGFQILLSHDPSHWSEEVITKSDIDLTLAGHTHGMQAGLSIGSKVWSPIQLKYKHWAGLYQKVDQYLYVNRGMGWLGFPGRIGMRPEITLFKFNKIT